MEFLTCCAKARITAIPVVVQFAKTEFLLSVKRALASFAVLAYTVEVSM
jgi:hypothetical protein